MRIDNRILVIFGMPFVMLIFIRIFAMVAGVAYTSEVAVSILTITAMLWPVISFAFLVVTENQSIGHTAIPNPFKRKPTADDLLAVATDDEADAIRAAMGRVR